MNSLSLFYSLLISVAFGYPVFSLSKSLSLRFGLLDYPSARKKHSTPIPIVGGICIFLVWTLSMLLYGMSDPHWTSKDSQSLAVMCISIWTLVGLGITDDVWSLSPKIKLVVQIAVAIFTLFFEPNLRETCLLKSESMHALQAILFIYAPAVVWILGITNAINLIDGIDGFAAGTSLLIALSCIAMQFLPGSGNSFALASLILLIPPLLFFLRKNWAPATIFLGDNGSLPLGFLLAVSALIHRKDPNLLVGVPSLLIMFAYPILDMGLCVYRRARNGYPMFKADRNHLHHRIRRFGLSTAKTTLFLLCIVAYCQMTAIFLSAVHFQLMVITTISFILSLFIFMYLMKMVESWRSQYILKERKPESLADLLADPVALDSALEINLAPLLEVGSFEEKEKIRMLVSSLHYLVQKNIRKSDTAFFSGHSLFIATETKTGKIHQREILKARINSKLLEFQKLFDLQYSIDGLPIHETQFPKESLSSLEKNVA